MSEVLEFNPARLTLARKRRGMTKTKLASAIGPVDLRSVSAYESGEFSPDEERLALIAKALRFPVEFFCGDDLEVLSPDAASFRAMSKMTAGQKDMALGAGAIALLVNGWIEERFELPAANLPDLSRERSPGSGGGQFAETLGHRGITDQKYYSSSGIKRRAGVLPFS